jgi:hypothetical protein
MLTTEQIKKRAAELAEGLNPVSEKIAFDWQGVLQQAKDLAANNPDIVRNAGIGAGAGTMLGLAGSRDGYRLGDMVRGASAGALLGGGGTAAYRALSPALSQALPGSPATQPLPSPEEGGGLLSFFTNRPVTSTLGAAAAVNTGANEYSRRFGVGRFGSRFNSPYYASEMGIPIGLHDPGSSKFDGVKSRLASKETYDGQVANRIRRNIASWRDYSAGDDFNKYREALGLLEKRLSDRELLEIGGNLRDVANPAGLDPIALQVARRHLDAMAETSLKTSPITTRLEDLKTRFNMEELDKYMHSRAPIGGLGMAKRIGGLGLLGIAEPYAIDAAKSYFAGDRGGMKLDADQIRRINEKYFQ